MGFFLWLVTSQIKDLVIENLLVSLSQFEMIVKGHIQVLKHKNEETFNASWIKLKNIIFWCNPHDVLWLIDAVNQILMSDGEPNF